MTSLFPMKEIPLFTLTSRRNSLMHRNEKRYQGEPWETQCNETISHSNPHSNDFEILTWDNLRVDTWTERI